MSNTCPNHQSSTRRTDRRKILFSLVLPLVAVLALTGASAFAALRAVATNATPQAVSSGTLTLTMNGGTFDQAVANMAPGDSRSQYVNLTNGGTLAGRNLGVTVVDSTPTVLSTDATRGLLVTVSNCTDAWSAQGTCTAPVPLLTAVPLAQLGTAKSLVSGDVAAGAVLHLKMVLALPDQVETVVNGVLPANTIQNRAATLTWTFSEDQRAATAS